jgi:hypothetical protein
VQATVRGSHRDGHGCRPRVEDRSLVFEPVSRLDRVYVIERAEAELGFHPRLNALEFLRGE